LIRLPPLSPLFPYTTLFRSIHFAFFCVGSVVYRLVVIAAEVRIVLAPTVARAAFGRGVELFVQTCAPHAAPLVFRRAERTSARRDRKSTRLNSSHSQISYAV